MITTQEVAELKKLSFEAKLYELIELVETHFTENSKYALSKFLVLSGWLKDELIVPFEDENDTTSVSNTKT